jgi:PAS domain S-box-containing protein
MKKAKILIVEDEAIIARNLKYKLEEFGYIVSGIVDSGQKALNSIKKIKIDLVLMDIMIHGKINGIETAKKIRSDFDIPVIYLTAYTDSDTIKEAKITEPFAYLCKPIKSEDLYAALEIAFYMHRVKKQLIEKDTWLSTLLRSISDAVIATDIKGKITFMNPKAEELCGWKAEESKGKSLDQVFKIIKENTHKPVTHFVEKILKSNTCQDIKNHILLISKNGKHIPIEKSGAPIKNDDGAIFGVVIIFKDITERKNAEDAVQKSEEKYRSLVEDNQNPIYLLDKNLTYLYANNSYISRFKVSDQDNIICQDYINFHSKKNTEEFRKKVLKVFESGKPVRYEYQSERDGKFFVRTLSPIKASKNGITIAVTVISTDISQRKTIEKKLRDSEEQFRNLANQSPNMIFINQKGKIVYANKRCEDIMGYKRKELYSPDFDFMVLVAPESKDLTLISFNRHQKGKEVLPFEYTLITKKEEKINAIVSTKLIKYQENNAILGIVTDITERKKSEELIAYQTDLLKKTFNCITDAIFVLNADDIPKIIDCNNAASHIFHYEKAEMIGKTTEFLHRNKESTHKFQALLLPVIEEGMPFHLPEFQMKRKDGSIFISEHFVNELLDDRGKRIGGISIVRDITKRKKTEEALRDAEQKWVSLTQNTNDQIIIADNNHKIQYINRTIYHESPDKLIGRSIYEYAAEDDYNIVRESIKKVYDTGKASNFEAALNVPDLDKKWYDTKIVPIITSDKISGIILIAADITERKKTLEKLKDSEEKYRLLIENSGSAITYFDSDGKCLFVNKQGIINHKGKDITGMSLYDIHPEVADFHMRRFVKIIKEDKGGHFEDMIKLPAGETWFSSNIQPVKDKNGNILGVQIISSDITKNKKMEEIIHSDRDRFRKMISALGEGMLIVNREFNIEYQNDVCINHFGNKTGQKCYVALNKKHKSCKDCLLNDTIDSAKIVRTEKTMVNGRHYYETISPFIDVNGEVKAIILQQDVTEKKELQAEAMRTAHLKSIGELAAGVAHEINNPITGIINCAQLLIDKMNEKKEDNNIPERILTEGERIAVIVRNLLSFARSDGDQKTSVSIRDVLLDSINLIQTQMDKQGITLKMNISSDLPKIDAHKQKLQQVFLNILSNACYALNKKFSGFHKDKIIEITSKEVKVKNNKYIQTKFHDHGKGIPSVILERICDPFITTKLRGEGTGLGLSICHNIIKDHDGKLYFESIEGQYTNVIINLPI